MKRASFIQIGETYFATIVTDTHEDVLTDGDGKNIPFDSAARAVAAATRRLAPLPAETIQMSTPGDSEYGAWKKEKAAEQVSLRAAFDLQGIEVVRKRRRAISRS